MKNAVILCAGAGTKLWPYSKIRNKVMFPISNKPAVAYSVDILTKLGFDNIVIVAGGFSQEIVSYFRDSKNVTVLVDSSPSGTASSLLKARDFVGGEDFLALYGDTILSERDIKALIIAHEGTGLSAALVTPITDRCSDHIGCTIENGKISEIYGHSREDSSHRFGGFALQYSFFEALQYNSGRFTCVEVGMMPPIEAYLEMSIADEMGRGAEFLAVESADEIYDLDKPWQLLQANFNINRLRCAELSENELGEGATIDETAVIDGFVKLGKNSHIGKNVIIEGSIIVGDNTVIKNGAIINDSVVIGNNCKIRNACFIEGGSSVGDDCVVSHAAELDGMILKRVYLYHYMEISGIIGENTDIGAATVCGSLRFDDGATVHKVKGRRELPSAYGDSVFIGDYCRTGVNAVLMPGVKIGSYSVVGAGVLLNKDIEDNTLIYCEQNQVEKKWGFEKYGW